MLLFSKEIFYQKTSPVNVLGKMPMPATLTGNSRYYLMKRGDEFFLVYNYDFFMDTTSTAVKTLDYIQKTTDFKTWTGSKIGSAMTRYDAVADAFFAVTLGLNYTTNMAAYHLTKINPDDFSYTTKTIMPETALSATSRSISHVDRIGNSLMLLYLKGSVTTNSYYSNDNGNTWATAQVGSASVSVGGSGIASASNGSRMLTMSYFGSTTMANRTFTAPTTSAATTNPCRASTNQIYTTTSMGYAYNSSTGVLDLSSDFVNYATRTLDKLLINSSGGILVYNNHLITSSTLSSATLEPYLGKIVLHNLANGKVYLFDPKLNHVYLTSGYYRNYMKMMSVIDGDLYFNYSKDSNNYFLAKVPINNVFEEMQEM